MKKNNIIALASFVILIFVIKYYYGFDKAWILDFLQMHKKFLLDFIARNYLSSILLYFVLMIGFVVSTLPISAIFTAVGGFLFGTVLGMLYSYLSSLIGAFLSFLMFRYLFGAYGRDRYKDKFETFYKKFEEHGSIFLLALYLFTVVPFFVTSAISSFSNISNRAFITITAIGILPGIVIYSILGSQLSSLGSIDMKFSYWMLVILLLLGVVVIGLPVLFKKICKV